MESAEVTVTKTAGGTMPASASFVICCNPDGGGYGEGNKIDSFDIPDHIIVPC
jgi:hypothetical protein